MEPPSESENAEILAGVRTICAFAGSEGPDEEHVCAGVRAFVATFDFRYIQVIRKSVAKYRQVIIERVNPLIRRFQLEQMGASAVAGVLVTDWAARNFVTAGGFAIEALAIAVGADAEKSATEGIDIQRRASDGSTYNLYVVKSGAVTRNSDILKALKTNSRKAEKILRGDKSVVGVTANYAIAAGRTAPTSFEDGVRRPSTEDFWSELVDLEPEAAVRLVLAMATEAGRRVRQDSEGPLQAMQILVNAYLRTSALDDTCDWAWIETRTMRERSVWVADDAARHARALLALQDAGYDLKGNRT